MSILNGEWWIDDSGYATYCDGDIGETNHEIEAYRSALEIDLDEVYEAYKQDDEAPNTLEDFLKGEEQRNNFTEAEIKWLVAQGANETFLIWCNESQQCDARDYALEHMGWIRVADDNFQMWEFNDEALKEIQNFDEWPEEDESGEELEKSEESIYLEEYSTNKTYSIPLRILFRATSVDTLKKYLEYPESFEEPQEYQDVIRKYHVIEENPVRVRADKYYDPEELQAGIQEEYEHTDSYEVAKKIAKQHLEENKFYYSRLKQAGLNPEVTTLIGYHARLDKNTFGTKHKSRTQQKDLTAIGIFFYGDKFDAERLYLGENIKREIIKAEVTFQNAFIFKKFNDLYNYTGVNYQDENKAEKNTQILKSLGHDGYIKLYQTKEGVDEFVAFDNSQVRILEDNPQLELNLDNTFMVDIVGGGQMPAVPGMVHWSGNYRIISVHDGYVTTEDTASESYHDNFNVFLITQEEAEKFKTRKQKNPVYIDEILVGYDTARFKELIGKYPEESLFIKELTENIVHDALQWFIAFASNDWNVYALASRQKVTIEYQIHDSFGNWGNVDQDVLNLPIDLYKLEPEVTAELFQIFMRIAINNAAKEAESQDKLYKKDTDYGTNPGKTQAEIELRKYIKELGGNITTSKEGRTFEILIEAPYMHHWSGAVHERVFEVYLGNKQWQDDLWQEALQDMKEEIIEPCDSECEYFGEIANNPFDFSTINARPEVAEFVNNQQDKKIQGKLTAFVKKKPDITLEEVFEEQRKIVNARFSTNWTDIDEGVVTALVGSLYNPSEKNFNAVDKWLTAQFKKHRVRNAVYSLGVNGGMIDMHDDGDYHDIYQMLGSMRDYIEAEHLEWHNFTWEELVDATLQWHEEIGLDELKTDREYTPLREENIVYKFSNNYFMVMLDQEQDYYTEGNLMQHCLRRDRSGPAYWNAYLDNKSRIYSLRDAHNHPHVTIEMGLSSGLGEEHFDTVKQIYGKQDHEPIPKYQALIKEWFTKSKTEAYQLDIGFDLINAIHNEISITSFEDPKSNYIGELIRVTQKYLESPDLIETYGRSAKYGYKILAEKTFSRITDVLNSLVTHFISVSNDQDIKVLAELFIQYNRGYHGLSADEFVGPLHLYPDEKPDYRLLGRISFVLYELFGMDENYKAMRDALHIDYHLLRDTPVYLCKIIPKYKAELIAYYGLGMAVIIEMLEQLKYQEQLSCKDYILERT